ncbi:MAG TPA: cyanophycin synthetase [Firmicutes bacterium]|nr:cyanophycin synthetase [Bacillota bacterium]
MKKIGLRIFSGRNVYTHRSAALVLLDLGELTGKESREIPGFNERLLNILPGLMSHGCATGDADGFVQRLQAGTYFGHILEHVLLELQGQLGLVSKYGKTRATDQWGVYEVIFECHCSGLAERLVDTGLDLLHSILARREYNLAAALASLERNLAQVDLGPSSKALWEAARRRGISVRRIGEGSLIQLGSGRYTRRIQATLTDHTSCLAADVAGDKALTKLILKAAAIPVPRGRVVRSVNEALNVWRELKCPVVLKPCDGNQGRGVSLNLNSEDDVVHGFAIASRFSPYVLLEEFIAGKHFRLLVVNDRLVAASERIPAHVVGNGRDTVVALIEEVNQDPLRGNEHEKPLTKITLDDIAKLVLARQGYDLLSIPAPGSIVWLRENANLSTGGTAMDVTDLVHPELAQTVVRAVRLIGLDVAGVDLVTADVGLPIAWGRGAIIEVNAAPGIRMHHFPMEGPERDVASQIIESLYPVGAPSEIPIVAVTGTNGKTTTCRLVAHVLRQCYGMVGLTSTAGIYHNDRLLVAGDTTGPWSARVLLDDPEVEVAVLELARGGLLRGGLAYDRCDVAILTNISEDHLGQDNLDCMEDLAWVKSLVLESVRTDGYVIMNADDECSMDLMPQQHAQAILFSLQPDNLQVRRHLGIGGRAVLVQEGHICLVEGDRCKTLVAVAEIPITFGGSASYNVANVLAACAALWGLRVEEDLLRQGLVTFLPDTKHNPGRQNLFSIGRHSVLVDYAHNVAGIQGLTQLARNLTKGELIGVIAAPGNRRTATVFNVGQAAGLGFDKLFIKEDRDRKGRAPGEVADILRQGALAVGLAAEAVQVFLEERTALWAAFAAAQPDDLIVVLYEDLSYTMSLLTELACEAQSVHKSYVVAGGL